MTRKAKIFWTTIILGSFLFQSAVLLLQAGYFSTPGGTPDSAGHKLGFNNPITSGLIWIMLTHISLKGLFAIGGWYFWLCPLAHLIGLRLIWTNASRKNRIAFFGVQTVLFPLGWIPMFWFTPVMTLAAMFGTFDGESITDGPINMFFAHTTWWEISIGMCAYELFLRSILTTTNEVAEVTP
ncbi:hypothetical protein GC207_00840 [bacterium]|nr:hypothetical protein [bacterium]